MSSFPYRSGRLCCEGVALESIARRFGTPVYVYSRRAVLGNFERISRRLSSALKGPSGPGIICYSVKANSNLAILRLLRRAGAGFDIVSGGELRRALVAGEDPARVVFSGVGKTAEEIDAALKARILMFNVESEGELDLLEARARHLKERAPVALRVNPEVEAETHPYVQTGRTIHKFGVPKAEALGLYRRAAASRHLQIRGVACHIGSQILEVEPFLRALDELLGVADALHAEKIEAELLDLGGGFGIRYRDETPLDVERLVGELAARMAGRPYRLILEPGRALVAEAGALLARVLYVKRNERKNFVVVDAGMNDLLRPALYGAWHEILPVRRREGEALLADVVGPLCETGDFLGQERELGPVAPGDLLAVMNAGAYGFVQSSNYNSRPRPAEVLVEGARAKLVRRRERVEDLFGSELTRG